MLNKLSRLFRRPTKGSVPYRCGYIGIVFGRLVPREDYTCSRVSVPSNGNHQLTTQSMEGRPHDVRGVLKIVSGGQTGVDRAALDVAMELGMQTGGWCPAGRRAADGVVPAHYKITEIPSGGYHKRTKWNVRDSDGTLIISPLPLTGGTLLTANVAEKLNKPCFIIDIDQASHAGFIDWLSQNGIAVMNVAGPREESAPGIHARAVAVLRSMLVSEMGRRDGHPLSYYPA